jgi:hypothetical protein
MLLEVMRRNFEVNWTHIAIFEQNPILFVDYVRTGERLYEEATEFNRLPSILDTYPFKLEGKYSSF